VNKRFKSDHQYSIPEQTEPSLFCILSDKYDRQSAHPSLYSCQHQKGFKPDKRVQETKKTTASDVSFNASISFTAFLFGWTYFNYK